MYIAIAETFVRGTCSQQNIKCLRGISTFEPGAGRLGMRAAGVAKGLEGQTTKPTHARLLDSPSGVPDYLAGDAGILFRWHNGNWFGLGPHVFQDDSHVLYTG